MSHKKPSTDTYHEIGYGENEQHLGKPKVTDTKEVDGPQGGLDNEEGSRICGQKGPELLGGSASTRILGQSVSEQLSTSLSSSNKR